jgi:hypothetical protein
VIYGRLKMWYLIFFTLGAAVGILATLLRYETKCRDCGVRENCEEYISKIHLWIIITRYTRPFGKGWSGW